MPSEQYPNQHTSTSPVSSIEAGPPLESTSPSVNSPVAPKSKDAVELSKEALAILQERMLTDPQDIPSGALLRFMETLAKLELARLANTTPDTDDEDQSVAQIIVAARGLPEDRQREVLAAQRARSSADVALVDAELTELETKEE